MQIRRIAGSACLAAALFLVATGSAGQGSEDRNEADSLRKEVGELRQETRDANDRHAAQIESLREEIERLKHDPNQAEEKGDQGTEVAEPNEPVAAAEENAQYGGRAGRTPQSFNPDISATGDVLLHTGENEEGVEKSQFQFRELELAFGAAVDPYGRADFFVSIEQEDGEFRVAIEEGYFTFDTLPHDLKARVGQVYSAFGKANQTHAHALPWADFPLVNRRFFGEEPMSEPGAELSWLVPNPWEKYIELVFQVQSNGNELSFAGRESRDLMYVTHLKNFFDLSSDSSLEVGGSLAAGPNAAAGDEHWTSLEGVDVTYKWRPAKRGLYRSLTWMNELLLSQKDEGAGDTVDSYGLYSSLEYQFSRRWSAYGRYDHSQFPDDSRSYENAFSPGLTFRQSEFAFWRLQYTHTEGKGTSSMGDRDELFLLLDFGIGPHRAHQY